MANKLIGLVLVAVLVACSLSIDAIAQERRVPVPAPGAPAVQEPVYGGTVATRARPDFDPIGIRAGSFFFFPQLGVTETYNDNIFAAPNNENSDFITDVLPQLYVASDWANHALNVAAGVDLGFYASETDENYQDWFTKADGRFDITRDIAFYAGAGASYLHEERGDPNNEIGEEPTTYYLYNGFGRYVHTLGRLNVTVDGNYDRYDYRNADAIPPADKVRSQDRDRNEYSGGARLGYELVPDYEAFARVSGNKRVYDTVPDEAGENRNSSGYEATVGVALDFGGISFGDVFVGYLYQDYPNLENVSGPTFGGSITWNATTLTTVNARVVRAIEETTAAGATAFLRTTGALTVDHELLRNVLVNGIVSVSNYDYEGIGRDDYVYSAGVGVKYLVNRNFNAFLNYRYITRDSNADSGAGSADYGQNTVLIGLQAQL